MILFTWGDEYVPVQKAPLGMEFNETAKAIGFRDGDVLISLMVYPLNVTVGYADKRCRCPPGNSTP